MDNRTDFRAGSIRLDVEAILSAGPFQGPSIGSIWVEDNEVVRGERGLANAPLRHHYSAIAE